MHTGTSVKPLKLTMGKPLKWRQNSNISPACHSGIYICVTFLFSMCNYSSTAAYQFFADEETKYCR